MTSPNPSHAEEMTHRWSVEIVGEDMPRSNPPNPYYQQYHNPPHPYYQQIPSQLHVDPNYNPQITSFSVGQGSTSFPSSSQYPSSSNQYP
jgi:hypothetical protein